MNGDWIAAIDLRGHWFLANLYTHWQIDLPPSSTFNIWCDESYRLGIITLDRYLMDSYSIFWWRL
jgi:hypothetical protein